MVSTLKDHVEWSLCFCLQQVVDRYEEESFMPSAKGCPVPTAEQNNDSGGTDNVGD